MANTLNLGSGNWGAKDSLLLGYYEDGGKFFPETFDVTRATGGTRVNKNGLIETPAEIGSEAVTNGDFEIDGIPSTNTYSLGWYSQTSNVLISGGKLTLTNSASESTSLAYATDGVSSLNAVTINKTYKLQYRVIENNGNTSFKYYSSGGSFIVAPTDLGVIHTIYIKNYTNQIFLFQNATTNSSISLDYVSLKEYNDKNLARIDYLDDAKGVLLTEPQSTNLIPYSEFLSTWANSSSTLNIGFTSPTGDTSAYSVLSGSGSSNRLELSFTSLLPNTTQSVSAFVKKVGSDNKATLLVQTTETGRVGVSFNFDTKILSNASGTTSNRQVQELVNGWFRISYTFTTLAAATSPNIQLNRGNPNQSALYWGAQVEGANALGYNGEYATSYIPTEGSTVTRNKDEVTNGGDVNSFGSEGVLYAEIAALANDLTFRAISLSNGTATNRVSIRYNNTSNSISAYVYQGATSVLSYNYIVSNIKDFHKAAIKYKSEDISFWVDGVEVSTSTSTFTLLPLTDLSFIRGDSVRNFYGKTKNVQVFNEALSDSDLLSLTTTGSVPYWTQYSAMATTLNYTNK